MPPGDILVFLDEFEHTGARLRLAADLAAAHRATLIGLRVEIHPHIPRPLRNPVVESALAAHEAAIRAHSQRLQAALAAAAAERGLAHEWWLVERGGMDDIVARARFAAVTVVHKHDRRDDEEFPANELIYQLLVRSGRPVLIAPTWPVTGIAGSRAVIAWNGSRESSRALADGLPLLAIAEQVLLLAPAGNGAEETVARLVAHLTRNGVRGVTSRLLEGDDPPEIGREILLAGNPMKANLLVIGGYSRSRLSERMFGGVTEFVLQHARLPVLMAH